MSISGALFAVQPRRIDKVERGAAACVCS